MKRKCPHPAGSIKKCAECRRAYQKAYCQKPEAREKARARDRKRYPKRAWEQRFDRRERLYGLSPNAFLQMLIDQRACNICFVPFERVEDAHIDHSHKTGKVRALLCAHCNTGLGFFDDDPVRMRAAAEYLERFK